MPIKQISAPSPQSGNDWIPNLSGVAHSDVDYAMRIAYQNIYSLRNQMSNAPTRAPSSGNNSNNLSGIQEYATLQNTGPWTPWPMRIPTPGGNSNMGVTASILTGAYQQTGKMVNFTIQFNGNFSGNNASSVLFVLPFTAATPHVVQVQLIDGNGAQVSGSGFVSGNNVTVSRYDGNNFHVGAVQFIVSGVYQAI